MYEDSAISNPPAPAMATPPADSASTTMGDVGVPLRPRTAMGRVTEYVPFAKTTRSPGRAASTCTWSCSIDDALRILAARMTNADDDSAMGEAYFGRRAGTILPITWVGG